MPAEDDLRLAWQADGEGRHGRRDVLLTLAAVSGALEGATWARAVRDRLVAHRPDHPFAGYPTLEEALDDPGVVAALARLRGTFPPARVRRLLDRADAVRGPYTGRRPATRSILDDLLGASTPTEAGRVPAAVGLADLPPSGSGFEIPTTADPLLVFYLSVLLAIATLLACVLREPGQGAKAA
jgi:hypothetical protein